MKKRMIAVAVALTLAFGVCSARLYSLSMGGSVKTAAGQGTYTLDVYTARGTVFDCNMTPITNPVEKYVAVLMPTAACVSAVREQLSPALAESIVKRLSYGKPITASVTSDFKCRDAKVFKLSERYSSGTAAHLIGYLSEGRGVSGIEKAYERLLCDSKPLTVSCRVDAAGRALSGSGFTVEGDEKSDDGVVLTIDLPLQLATEEACADLRTGAAIVMDSATGKIRAMCSFPTFSPADVAASLDGEDSPLINRALLSYNVGSTFKLCVAAAAIENGIGIFKSFSCPGSVKLGADVFHCHDRNGHGVLNMRQAIADSCNVYFIKLAREIGAENLYAMALKFGVAGGIDIANGISASRGILPDLDDIVNSPGALANFSFGQGELMMTPLHVAAMTAAFSNGGFLVTPTVVEGVIKDGEYSASDVKRTKRIISQSTAAQISSMMADVVENGTGRAAKPENGAAGGKTASAQTGLYKNGAPVTQAWFAGYCEGYTIVVLRENGTSGAADCAPVFKKIADFISARGK